MNTKVKIQLGLIVILIIIASSLILSQKASPSLSPLFKLKRLQENTFLKLKSNPKDKINIMSSMLDSRLEEIKNLVESKNYNYVLNASLRYSTLAGQITELTITNNFKDKVPAITDQFTTHQKVLLNLYEIYPKNIPGNVEWKYIQDDYNYLKLYLDKLPKVK